MYCEAHSLVKRESDHHIASPLRCKRWTCENCAPLRQRELKHLARAGKPNLFITLTVNPARGESPTARANALRDAWQIIVRRARAEARRNPGVQPTRPVRERHWTNTTPGRAYWPNMVRLYDGRLPFLIVFELTKKGEPHVHIALRAKWIDMFWLSREMEALTGAPIVDVDRINDLGRVAYYVSKYMSKAPERFEGCKRYWRSLDWLDCAEPDDDARAAEGDGWRIIWKPFDQIIQSMTARGWKVIHHRYSAELWPP